MTTQFVLEEIEVCQGVPPPDPVWPMLMTCCLELLNTAMTEFRLRTVAFDHMVMVRGNILECMRDVIRWTGDYSLQHPFDAADEMLHLISAYERTVQVQSSRTELETRKELCQIGARMVRALYYYVMQRPLVDVNRNLGLRRGAD